MTQSSQSTTVIYASTQTSGKSRILDTRCLTVLQSLATGITQAKATAKTVSFRQLAICLFSSKNEKVHKRKIFTRINILSPKHHRVTNTGGQHCQMMKLPQSLPLQMAESLLRARSDSVANHVTDRSISDRRALTRLATKSGWARSERSTICLSVVTGFHMTWIGGMVSRIYIYRSVVTDAAGVTAWNV